MNTANQWNRRYSDQVNNWAGSPRDLLVNHANYLPPSGLCLDIAMGLGANSGFLISRGLSVIGVDISQVAVQYAKRKYPCLHAVIGDLTQYPLPENRFDVILNFYYLQRNLWNNFSKTLKPGGLIFIEALTRAMLEIKPELPEEYLLENEELKTFFCGWKILYYKEGWTISRQGEKAVASLIAQKLE